MFCSFIWYPDLTAPHVLYGLLSSIFGLLQIYYININITAEGLPTFSFRVNVHSQGSESERNSNGAGTVGKVYSALVCHGVLSGGYGVDCNSSLCCGWG